jgi:hypothetical protein
VTSKRKALKALLILAVVLLLSMFFARTVQTITTAKVQKITATRGKLEDKIEVKGEIRFSEGESFTVEGARKLNLSVERVLAKRGYLMKAGDVLFTASIPGFDDEVQKIRESYDKKVRELTVEVSGHIRLPQESEHNRYYNEVLQKTDVYYDKLYLAQAAAIAAGKPLPQDLSTWNLPAVLPPRAVAATPTPAVELTQAPGAGAQLVQGRADAGPAPTEIPATPAPEAAQSPAVSPSPSPTIAPEVLRQQELDRKAEEALKEAYAAKATMDEATNILRRIYQGTGPVRRTGDAVYDYIKKTDGMREEISKLSEQMLELNRLKAELIRIRVPRDGWLTEFSLKAGDKYDGSKAAYTLSRPGEVPMLRCDITEVKKPLSKGMKARLEGSEVELTIADIEIAADSKKYAVIPLDAETLSSLGGLSKLMAAPQNVTIAYRSGHTTTLIPASALRTDGENKYFVYVVQQGVGGMLSNTTYTVRKQSVTVVETSSKLAALEDELSYVEIADREDRPLSDGLAVMEYVD